MLKRIVGFLGLCLLAFLPVTQAEACDCPMMHAGAHQEITPCPMHSQPTSSVNHPSSQSDQDCGCGMQNCHCAGHAQGHFSNMVLFAYSPINTYVSVTMRLVPQKTHFNSIFLTQDNPPPRTSLA